MLDKIKTFYWDNGKRLMLIPLIILILAIAQIGFQTVTTGDFVNKGVSLKGGLTLTIPSQEAFDIVDIENSLLNQFPDNEINVRTISGTTGGSSGLIIESDMLDEDEQDSLIHATETLTSIEKQDFSVEVMGSSLGNSFFKQTLIALCIAFLFMGIVVFIYFRGLIPSGAVVFAAFSDMVITLGVINLLNMKLSTAGIAAFLMLIGYSVDTNILLTIKSIKKREGTIQERIFTSIKTGLTMTTTTLVAITVALIVTKSEIIAQIMTILLIGLMADLLNTWLLNVNVVRWYAKKKKIS
jgi:preprotein translocase subunit SecF